jgi:anti-sigma factor RsiW
MTRHVSEDTIIQLTLGLLNRRAEENVRRHLGECPACRMQAKEVQATIDQIKEVTPQIHADMPALPSLEPVRSRWLAVAAVLAAGIGLGFIASESLRPSALSVVPQQIVPRSPDQARYGYVTCDEIDLLRETR